MANGCSNRFRTISNKFCIFKADGVLYAALECTPELTRLKLQQLISEACFHTIDDSQLLREAHECAEDILSKAPQDVADKLRNIPDQHMYGTVTMHPAEHNKKVITYNKE